MMEEKKVRNGSGKNTGHKSSTVKDIGNRNAVSRPKKKRKRSQKRYSAVKRVLLTAACVLMGVLLAGTGSYAFLKWNGSRSFQERRERAGNTAGMTDGAASVHAEALPSGTLRYQGKTYAPREQMLTFLCMGIDRDGKAEASADLHQGGQADALFLAALDLEEKTVSIIGVNRDTMAEIDTYDANGLYAGTQTQQIALAHAYGDGLEKSCENTVKAVSKLFYDIPIHGYAALNMEVVTVLNDAIGGVDVVIPESAAGADMGIGERRHKTGWKTGDKVHLMGDDAYTFIRYRDESKAQSAEERLARQKQYLNAFIGKAREAVKKDLTLPVKIYTQIQPYMVTDIAADEAVYLATEALSLRFSPENIYSMEGEVRMGEEFEEFYADETALYELILKVFYKEIQ